MVAENKLINSKKKMLISIFLVTIILAAKLFGAFITNSLALFSDSWHLVTDLIALLISWWGLKASTKPATYEYTFGHYRHSILTALINNVSLICISLFIFYKAVERYVNPVSVEPKGMILMAMVGLVFNSIIVINLRGSSNINVKSAFLHFVGDTLADMGVLFGGIIIYFTGWVGIDTLLSAILGCLILRSAAKMTLECVKILLEATPDGISVKKLKNQLKSINGVIEVTDLHVWSLSAEVPSMTAHVCIEECRKAKCGQILQELQKLIEKEFGIEHSTIQFEFAPCDSCFFNDVNKQTNCIMCIDSTK